MQISMSVFCVTVAMCLASVGCSRRPTKDYEQIVRHAANENWKEVWISMTPRAQEQIEYQQKFLVTMAQKMVASPEWRTRAEDEGRRECEATAKLKGLEGQKLFAAVCSRVSSWRSVYVGVVVLGQEVDGNSAVLEVERHYDGTRRPSTVYMVRRDGKWLIAFRPDKFWGYDIERE